MPDYSSIPLELIPIEEDGYHIFVRGRINGLDALLLIDTGASRSVFDRERIMRFFDPDEPVFEKMEKLSTGLGTNSMESMKTVLSEFRLGSTVLNEYRAVVLDMKHVNQSYSMLGIQPIDGVIGGDLLVELGAVIDYENKLLRLNE